MFILHCCVKHLKWLVLVGRAAGFWKKRQCWKKLWQNSNESNSIPNYCYYTVSTTRFSAITFNLQNKRKQVVNKAFCKWCGLIPPPVWPVLTHIFLLWYGKQCEKYLGLCYRHRCHQRGETGLIDGLPRRRAAVWTPPAAHSVLGVSAFLDEKWSSVSLPRQKVQQCE